MRRKTFPPTVLLVAALCLALAAPALAQSEGYDPMRQITRQMAKPNMMLVVDVSGSMTWDQAGRSVGVDSTGVMTTQWSRTSSGCSGATCTTWSYTLTVNQPQASRMATLKNALGSTVVIYTPWVPPNAWPIFPRSWTSGTVVGPVVVTAYPNTSYTWEVTYRRATADPGVPFEVFNLDGTLAVGTGYVRENPKSLVLNNMGVVNWGLTVFGSSAWNACNGAVTLVPVSSDDNNQGPNANAINDWMRLRSAGGLDAPSSQSTPTRLGIAQGGNSLATVTYPADPKAACDRTYGLILVTDGMSNACNPSHSCWLDPFTGQCDSPIVGSRCPVNYASYPAGVSETLFLGAPAIRTWVIGISQTVGRCELNMTAYMGRTDAHSPMGDAGFDTANDPYLPVAAGDTAHFDLASAHGDYAYFATNSSAMADALDSILAASAAGDYTTASPITSSAVGPVFALLASAEFPKWKGHLYAYNASVTPVQLQWDAGWNLSKAFEPVDKTAVPWVESAVPNGAYVAPAARVIYSWNPSTNALIEVTAGNLAALRTAAALIDPTFDTNLLTASVVDFIRGNNGSGVGRPWRLGSIINSTPGVIENPLEYKQAGRVEDHGPFQSANTGRTPMVMVGADDGMMHFFRLLDGSEIFALLPPNMLARQVDLLGNYDAVIRPTGQPTSINGHIYGVAGSPRFGDVYKAGAHANYYTVLLLTEGPGGNLVAAFDIENPELNMLNGDPPCIPLWTKTGAAGSLPGLFNTWSTPASAATAFDEWSVVMGAGDNPASTRSAQVAPKVFKLNPITGAATTFSSITNVGAPAPFVGNQTFADSVIFETAALGWAPDNIANMGVQADLNGRVWFLPSPAWAPSLGIDATAKAGQQQPIYYAPSVSGYKKSGIDYNAYTFGSGSFYERSDRVTGTGVGDDSDPANFIPSLYFVIKDPNAAQAPDPSILRVPIKDIPQPPDPITGVSPGLVSQYTQLTAGSLMLIPNEGSSAAPLALYLLYDSETGCHGNSYIVIETFDINAGSVGGSAATADAGQGAGSGFAVAGGKVVVAKSGVGSGQRASIETVPGVAVSGGSTGEASPLPVWWRQIK